MPPQLVPKLIVDHDKHTNEVEWIPDPEPGRGDATPRAQPTDSVPKSNPKMKLNLHNIHMSLTNVIQYVSFSSPLLLGSSNLGKVPK